MLYSEHANSKAHDFALYLYPHIFTSFVQVVIFVKSVSRAKELNKLLVECNFPSICIHGQLSQTERLEVRDFSFLRE